MKGKLFFISAIMTLIGLMSCQNGTKPASEDAVHEDSISGVELVVDPLQKAIGDYLADSIGSQYSQGDVCIPVVNIVDSVSSNDTLKVWGDFWVYNFKIVEDTLKTVSGGSHPGLLSLSKQKDNVYQVLKFDQVADGANYLPSAQRIFGERYDALQAISSNQAVRDSLRARAVVDFARIHKIPVKMLQDYGWPAVTLP